MKYLKFTLFMFVVCLFMSYTPTDALGVVGLEIKAYKGETSLGTYKTKKEDFTVQKYTNTGTVKLYGDGDYTNIMVKICKKGGIILVEIQKSEGKNE